MKKMSFIEWFVRLVKQDMSNYEEDVGEKQKIYDSAKKKIINPRKNKGKVENGL